MATILEAIDHDGTYSEPCYGDHTYERINPFTGQWYTVNGRCDCDVVDTGIVTQVRRFAVRTTGSDILDLPF